MGASNDLAAEGTRRLVVNGIYWAVGLPVPKNGTKVNAVGDYQPSMFGFHREDGYWQRKRLMVSDFDLK